MISEAGDVICRRNVRGALSILRHQSHSAGCLRPVGRDEDILSIHDEVGRSKEGRKAITEGPSSPARKLGQRNGNTKPVLK